MKREGGIKLNQPPDPENLPSKSPVLLRLTADQNDVWIFLIMFTFCEKENGVWVIGVIHFGGRFVDFLEISQK